LYRPLNKPQTTARPKILFALSPLIFNVPIIPVFNQSLAGSITLVEYALCGKQMK
jgi:hypothetical protein